MAKLLTKNRKAFHDYSIVEEFTAGIKLLGYEVKAVKEGKATFTDAYVQLLSGVPHVVNLYIGRYSKQGKGYKEDDSKRSRLLLLNQSEIEKLKRELAEKGKTAIPLALVLEHNLIKLEFGVVKGKKEFEKKVVTKERQIKRDLERETKEFGKSS